LFSQETWIKFSFVGSFLHPFFKGNIITKSPNLTDVLDTARLKAMRFLQEQVALINPEEPRAITQRQTHSLDSNEVERFYGVNYTTVIVHDQTQLAGEFEKWLKEA